MLKVNGIDLEEFDIFDAEVMEKYENGLKKIADKEYNYDSLSKIIKAQCEDVFIFFNELFGEGTDKKIFGDKTNLKVCLSAMDELIQYVGEQTKEIESITGKYSANRAKRK